MGFKGDYMYNKYLPLGTVVLLKEGQALMVITGYKMIDGLYNMYDYCGCIYPYGYTSDQKGLFNHSQIAEIIHLGYQDQLYQEHNQKLLNS